MEESFVTAYKILTNVQRFLEKIDKKQLKEEKKQLIDSISAFQKTSKIFLPPEFTSSDEQDENYADVEANSSNSSVYNDVQTEPDNKCQNLLSDYLEVKQENIFKSSWKKSWCVIRENFLFICKASDNEKKKVTINLKGCVIIDSDSLTKEGSKKERCFGITITSQNSKPYWFCAQDEATARKWKSCIANLCERDSRPSRNYPHNRSLPDIPSTRNDEEKYTDNIEVLDVPRIHPRIKKDENYDETYDDACSRTDESLDLGAKNEISQLHAPNRFGPPVIPKKPVDLSNRYPSISKNTSLITQDGKVQGFKLPSPINSAWTDEHIDLSKKFKESISLEAMRERAGSYNCIHRGQNSHLSPTASDFNCKTSFMNSPLKSKVALPLPNRFVKSDENDQSDDEDYKEFVDVDIGELYQGMWDCNADEENELSFKRGQVIRIISKQHDLYGWWIAEKKGKIGFVPKEYLTEAYEI